MRETNANRLSSPDKGACLSTPDSAHKPQDWLQFIIVTALSTALATKLSCKSNAHTNDFSCILILKKNKNTFFLRA